MFFTLEKMKFLTHWEFCTYCRIFGLREDPEYFYRLADVLHKQTTREMKSTSSIILHSAITFSDEQGAKFT